MKSRKARPSVNDLANAMAGMQSAQVVVHAQSVPPQSVGGGEAFPTPSLVSTAVHPSVTESSSKSSISGSKTAKAGAIAVYGSYELPTAAAPTKAAPVRVDTTQHRAAAPAVVSPDDTQYRVYTPVQPKVGGGGYAARHGKGTAAAPPKQAIPRYASTPTDDVDSGDDAPPVYAMDEDDGREMEDGDIWRDGDKPAKKFHAVVKSVAAAPAPAPSPSVKGGRPPKPPSPRSPAKLREMAFQRVGMDGPDPNVPGTYARSVDGKPSVSDGNERRAVSNEDKLYYSKKARPVEYKPKTLEEYKRVERKEYVQLGTLGADLDSDELVEKRANRARVKHFSSQLRELNKESVPECSAPIVPVAPVEREAAKEKRNRALEFAKQVPRPKVSSARTSSQPPKGGEPRPHSSDGGLPGGYDEGSTLRMSAVEELEAKHLHMRAQVDAIRREYGV